MRPARADRPGEEDVVCALDPLPTRKLGDLRGVDRAIRRCEVEGLQRLHLRESRFVETVAYGRFGSRRLLCSEHLVEVATDRVLPKTRRKAPPPFGETGRTRADRGRAPWRPILIAADFEVGIRSAKRAARLEQADASLRGVLGQGQPRRGPKSASPRGTPTERTAPRLARVALPADVGVRSTNRVPDLDRSMTYDSGVTGPTS